MKLTVRTDSPAGAETVSVPVDGQNETSSGSSPSHVTKSPAHIAEISDAASSEAALTRDHALPGISMSPASPR